MFREILNKNQSATNIVRVFRSANVCCDKTLFQCIRLKIDFFESSQGVVSILMRNFGNKPSNITSSSFEDVEIIFDQPATTAKDFFEELSKKLLELGFINDSQQLNSFRINARGDLIFYFEFNQEIIPISYKVTLGPTGFIDFVRTVSKTCVPNKVCEGILNIAPNQTTEIVFRGSSSSYTAPTDISDSTQIVQDFKETLELSNYKVVEVIDTIDATTSVVSLAIEVLNNNVHINGDFTEGKCFLDLKPYEELFKIVLHSWTSKIKAIKYVRDLTGLNLSEAKNIVEGPLPVVLKNYSSRNEAALAHQEALTSSGADTYITVTY